MARMTIGFHTSGSGGNPTGIGDYVSMLDAAGIPATIACADGDVGIGDALALMNSGSNVPHVLIFRVVKDRHESYAVPNYDEPDHAVAARDYWNKIRPHFNSNVVANKDKVWIAIGNELDQNKANWLGFWAVETAMVANAEGFKVLAWNWAAGTPDYPAWETPGMLAYLSYAANNPTKAAVGVHEYSYTIKDLFDGDGDKVGRYRHIYKVCRKHNLPRPVILIKEFGYSNDETVDPDTFEKDLLELFKKYPDYPPAAKWYLGPWPGSVTNQTQLLIKPLTDLTLKTQLPDISLPDSPLPDPGTPPPPPPPPPAKPPAAKPRAKPARTTGRLINLEFTGWGEQDVAADPAKAPAAWYDVANVQVPIVNGRRMDYWCAEGANQFADGQPWNDFKAPEGVHRWDDLLPAHEHFLLNDSGRCYHLFGPSHPWWARFSLPVRLVPVRYRLTLDLWGDWVNLVNGQKVAKPDPIHARVELYLGDRGREEWLSPNYNAQSTILQEFEVTTAGEYELGFGIQTVFAAGGGPGANGCFLRSFAVDRVEVVAPPGTDPGPGDALKIKHVNAPAGLWLREAPSTGGTRIQLMPHGTAVEVLAEGDWDQIRVDGVTGFASSQYLSAGD